MSYVVVGDFVVVPLSDVVLPPLSSKVLKYVVEVRGGFLGGLSRSARPFKPLQITPLFLDGRPLISFRVGGPPIYVRGGTQLYGRVSAVVGDCGVIDEFTSLSGVFETPYGRFRVDVGGVEVVKVSSLTLGLSKRFAVEFVTPTIITCKHMLPTSLRHKARKLAEGHRLIPQPSFIFSYLLKLWNSVVEPKERIPNESAGDLEAYKLGRLADVTVVEVDYRLRPVTVLIGRDSKGRLRTTRAFKGWVTYECLTNKLLNTYDKLLALATHLGVGRSRGIGFGVLRAKPLNTTQTPEP